MSGLPARYEDEPTAQSMSIAQALTHIFIIIPIYDNLMFPF